MAATINFNALKLQGATSETARKHNALVDAVKSIAIAPGVGYRSRQTTLGTVLDINPGTGGGGSPCPFTVYASPGTTPGTLDVTLYPGSVNQLLPTNYSDTFNVSATGLKYVIITATTDGEKVTSSTITVGTTAPAAQVPTPNALPTSVQILVAIISASTVYRLIGCGSITLTGSEQYRTDKASPAEPGQLAYKPYYVWNIGTV